MWEDLKFKWIFSLKIQINYKKPGKFGWKDQLKTWSHFQGYHSIQVRLPFIFYSSKIGYIPCKTMSYVEFPYRFRLRPMAQATLV